MQSLIQDVALIAQPLCSANLRKCIWKVTFLAKINTFLIRHIIIFYSQQPFVIWLFISHMYFLLDIGYWILLLVCFYENSPYTNSVFWAEKKESMLFLWTIFCRACVFKQGPSRVLNWWNMTKIWCHRTLDKRIGSLKMSFQFTTELKESIIELQTPESLAQ